ncbi:hypothetical protein VSQ78_16535 [Nocardiopsis alba]|uniref:Uncharacterized protein n=1 Tax=Nocardiopsis alba TaxID=53437 RepID=A0ABV5DXJ1_9ACTN
MNSRESEGSQYCAADPEVSYSDDAFETLTAPRYTEEDAEEDVDSEIIDLADRDLYIPVGSADELEEHLLEQVEEYPDFEEELIDRLGTRTRSTCRTSGTLRPRSKRSSRR